MKQRTTNFSKKNRILLEKIKEILQEYEQQNIKVTLRQLYYQLVARDLIPNKISEYAKLSGLLTNARYSEDIEWDAIEDRTRIPDTPNFFRNIKHLIETAKHSYQLDRWKGQKYYVEVWTEKDALSSVIQPITRKYQVTLSVNRGYSSASAMHEAFERGEVNVEEDGMYENREKIILYLGDHDPSGLDMDRDIKERLEEFGDDDTEVIRIGLTKEQIEQYNPPPNPAKITDPRAKKYIENHGNTSWEVDALRPEILQELIKTKIKGYLDEKKFNEIMEQEEEEIKQVEEFADKLKKEENETR